MVWFSATQGYGFIKPFDETLTGGKDIFTHFHFIVQSGFKSLRADDEVEFSIGTNAKGICAKEVKIIQEAG